MRVKTEKFNNNNKFFEVMKNKFNNPDPQRKGVKKSYFLDFINLLMC
jgi:hypothetical protein